MAEVLDLDTVKFKKLFDIRWLSFGQALDAFCRNFPVLIVLLVELDEEDEPVARGLLNRLRQFKVVATIHCLADVLRATNHLNLKFQFRDITWGSVARGVSRFATQLKLF